jgi:hypothetical protein
VIGPSADMNVFSFIAVYRLSRELGPLETNIKNEMLTESRVSVLARWSILSFICFLDFFSAMATMARHQAANEKERAAFMCVGLRHSISVRI